MKTQHKIPALLAVAGLAIVSLGGCSEISDAVHNEASLSFGSTAKLNGNWDRTVSWVPADATHILVHESTTTSTAPAILSIKTASQLSTGACTKTTRLSGPDFSQSWSPANAFVKDAWVCGDWDVIPTSTGYYAWTPNSPKERAAVAK